MSPRVLIAEAPMPSTESRGIGERRQVVVVDAYRGCGCETVLLQQRVGVA